MPRKLLIPLALFLNLQLPFAQSQTPPKDTSRLGAFIIQLLEVQSLPEGEQSRALQEAFAQTPDIIRWVLDNQSLQQAINESPLSRVDKNGNLSTRFHEWIQNKLGGRIQTVISELNKTLEINGDLHNISDLLSDGYANLPLSTRRFLMSIPPKSTWSHIDQELEQILSQIKIGEMDFMKKMTRAALREDVHPAMKSFFEIILGNYFDALPPQFRVPVFSGFFELSKEADWTQFVAVLLKRSGVVFQKIAQLFGREVTDESLRKILALSQSDLEPALTVREAHDLFKATYGIKIEEAFLSFDEKPLAVASTGQVHRAVLKSNGQSVVLKFRKPLIIENAKLELQTIRKLAGNDTSVFEIVARFESKLFEELNYKNEAFFTDLFEAIYEQEGKLISTVKRVKEFKPSEGISITYFSAGKKVSKYVDEPSLKIRAKAVAELIGWWFEVALFSPDRVKMALKQITPEWHEFLSKNPTLIPQGQGLTGFHGDLHPGNLFLTLPREANSDLTSPYLVTLLDFGNVAFLTAHQRRSFIRLILASITESEDRMVEALQGIAKFDSTIEVKVRQGVLEIFKLYSEPMVRMNRILGKVLGLGVEIPDDFYSFIRGRAMLDLEIKEINKLLGPESPDRVDTDQIYKGVVLRKILSVSGMARKLYDSEYRKSGTITPGLILEFIRDYSQKWLESFWSCNEHLLPAATHEK